MAQQVRAVLVLVMFVVACWAICIDAAENGVVKVLEDHHEDVVVLTLATLPDVIKLHPFVIAQFYFSGCKDCLDIVAPAEYAKAATELKNHEPPIVLAKVELTNEPSDWGTFSYGYEMVRNSLWIYRDERLMRVYEQPNVEVKLILANMEPLFGPPSVHLSSAEQAEEIRQKSKFTVVGLFKSLESNEYQDFVLVADQHVTLYTGFRFAHTLDSSFLPDVGVAVESAPAVCLYKHFDDGFSDVTGLWRFLDDQSHPRVIDVNKDPQTAQWISSESYGPVVSLLVDTHSEADESYKTAYAEAAKAFHPKGLRFLIVSNTTEDFNAEKYELPAIEMRYNNYFNEKYVHHNIKASEISSWLQLVLDGKVDEAYAKSDEVPEENDLPVKEVVRKSFKGMVLQSGKNVLLVIYVPWCEWSRAVVSTLDELAVNFANDLDIIFAKMDGTNNAPPAPLLRVYGFPDIYLHTATGNFVRFDDSKTTNIEFDTKPYSEFFRKELLEFIKKHRTPILKANVTNTISFTVSDSGFV